MGLAADEWGIAFGRWRLLPRARRLLADGVPVPLGSRAFDLLLVLVEADGALVTKDDLLRQVWPGATVEEHNIQVQVSALRKALGGDAARLVATIPGRGYRFAGQRHDRDAPGAVVPTAAGQPRRPSSRSVVVVLPFADMTGDPAQAYFADGFTEDLTTALSHVRWFSVIARNSAATYKGRAVDLRQIGQELGVGYVVEGSVRKAGNRLRVTAQLSEATTGLQVWGDRFDGDLDDIFAVQDRLVEAVVGAIEPSLLKAEIRRAHAKHPESLDAYDLYLQAVPHHGAVTLESNDAALRLLRDAIALDPHFVAAKGALVMAATQRVTQGWAEPADMAAELRLARSLVEGEADEDPTALARAAHTLSFLGQEHEAGLAGSDRALRLAPNSATVLDLSGLNRLYVDDWRVATARIERAMRLSPLDPHMFYRLTSLGGACFVGERYLDAASWLRQAISHRPRYVVAHRLLAASLAALGEHDAARDAVSGLLAAAPGYTVTAAAARTALRGATRERYLDGLRRAGLPE